MTAVWLLVVCAVVMLAISVTMGVCAYRVRSDKSTLVLGVAAFVAFVLASVAFGDALVRVDDIEGTKPPVEIKPPF